MKLFSHYKLGNQNDPLYGNIKHLALHNAVKIFSLIEKHHPNSRHSAWQFSFASLFVFAPFIFLKTSQNSCSPPLTGYNELSAAISSEQK